ncbi:neuralized-like protein 4 [Lingula anatina]|uniref:Neuralized-like protein 4 n=1 Tax=Lingula anatina TaxID=7574 RepID=A0A1S3K8K5_LINAN|nr:neuralized-like protein 4 [Lingula anatina]|eukprot:XP_013418958.1 neuralized-like protein 4 [Lingula anatina]
MSASFHSRAGAFITLSNNNRTAQRNHPNQEFNNGVVLSVEPLRDNQLFEVKIDRKVNSWSGSIEIGVTASDPNHLNFPTSATGFRENTWVMSGSSILKDGHSLIEEYGIDLDTLDEGDKVGVMKTSNGELHFFVNGQDQGEAVSNLPNKVYAVIDLYGKCAQVSVLDSDSNRETAFSNEIAQTSGASNADNSNQIAHSNERLLFHERCGSLVKLTNNRRTAERRRPLDEFNNGVVMTNRPLKDDELFEIRIERLVDKWSGSIEVGITTHNPVTLDYPATMTNMRSGTIMMSGCGILTNGKGTRREYGDYNLDELREGDRIGLIKKSNGCLHYYINGVDQGVAATKTAQMVWGVVDLYGMAVKVTILDPEECPSEPAALNRSLTHIFRTMRDSMTSAYDTDEETREEVEKLLFHPRCGSHASIINWQRTASRPNAMEDFNHGVCITNRFLRPGETFEVQIDKMVEKWAGSIEIGVTTHSATDLDFPSTMTNVRSGTWMMTGNGVMHNGTTVIDEYGQNLDRLKVGDRLGVVRKPDGTLHFYVNGIDQGSAATNIPPNVYGVIDLYGQAAQATIVDSTDPVPTSMLISSDLSVDSDELGFHHIHGKNACILPGGRTATRPNARGEFNDAIIMSNRPLRDNEMFEIVIEKMVDRWSGSIEAGVTLIRPHEIDLPSTMTDIDYDTWMLSGSSIMQDGSTIRNSYSCDLDLLGVGARIGMMRTSEGDLHFFVDGEDMGVACSGLPSGVYAVVDLYGQCAQVSICNGQTTRFHAIDNHSSLEYIDQSLSTPVSVEVSHRFSVCCGKNVAMKNNGTTACRTKGFNEGLVFSSEPLRNNELFEVRVDQLAKQWSGSLHIGLTTMAISDTTPTSHLTPRATDLRSKAKVTWVVCGSEVKKNGVTVKENCAPSLERLEIGDTVGIKRSADATMHVYVNGEDLGVAASNIPKNVFAIIDLYGMAETVTVTSSAFPDILTSPTGPPSMRSESSDSLEKETDQDTAEGVNLHFHGNHGKNINLSNKNMTASRTASYNQGIVITQRPLPRNHIFQIRLDKLNPRWTSSVMIGVTGTPADKQTFPSSAISVKKMTWIIQGTSVFQNGVKVKEKYGCDLDAAATGHVIGVMVDSDSVLHLYVDGVDQGPAARDIPKQCYGIVDLYGQCEEVTIVTEADLHEEVVTADREKADIEDGMKENICQSPPPEVNTKIRNCEYQNTCARLKIILGLPDGYFSPEHNMCYCETCHKIRGDESYYKRGDPPKDYAVPFGWCRFALKVPHRAQVLNVFEKWHIAFHGTRFDCVRRILDCGDLLMPGDLAMGGHQLATQPGHFNENKKPDGFDIKQIFLSPTIRYSGCQTYAPKCQFRDPKTKKLLSARVAFQVHVKPGSYKVAPQTIGANEQIDPKLSNNELEWSTKERGSIVLYGLLIKVEQ